MDKRTNGRTGRGRWRPGVQALPRPAQGRGLTLPEARASVAGVAGSGPAWLRGLLLLWGVPTPPARAALDPDAEDGGHQQSLLAAGVGSEPQIMQARWEGAGSGSVQGGLLPAAPGRLCPGRRPFSPALHLDPPATRWHCELAFPGYVQKVDSRDFLSEMT